VFDDNPFSQQNKENDTPELAPDRPSQPHRPLPQHSPQTLLFLAPGLLPATAFPVSPGAGVKAGRRPPAGLGLDAGEDDATLPQPGAGPITDPK
jgi:hypothetical protein